MPLSGVSLRAILGALVHHTLNAMNEVSDNGVALRELIEVAGLTQVDALAALNKGQAFPIALSTWKAYLAAPDSARRRACPDHVLEHARKTIGKTGKSR